MMAKESDDKIGWREFFAIISYAIAMKATDYTAVLLVKEVDNVIWAVPIISVIVILFPLSVLLSILNTYKDKNLVEIIYNLTGKFLGTIINLILFLIILLALVINTYDYIDIISTLFLLNTPIPALYIFFIGIVYFIASRGLEAIGRACWITFIPLTSIIIILIIIVWKDVIFPYLFPIAGPGLFKVIETGISYSSIFGDIFVLSIFYPKVRNHKSYKSGTFLGIGFSTFFLSSLFMILVAIFGSRTLKLLAYPYMELTRVARIGRYFPNLDSPFFFFWIIASSLRFSIYLYAAAAMLGNTLHKNNYEKLLLPISILTVFLGSLFKNTVQSTLIARDFLIKGISIPFILLPFILLGLSKFKGVSKK